MSNAHHSQINSVNLSHIRLPKKQQLQSFSTHETRKKRVLSQKQRYKSQNFPSSNDSQQHQKQQTNHEQQQINQNGEQKDQETKLKELQTKSFRSKIVFIENPIENYIYEQQLKQRARQFVQKITHDRQNWYGKFFHAKQKQEQNKKFQQLKMKKQREQQNHLRNLERRKRIQLRLKQFQLKQLQRQKKKLLRQQKIKKYNLEDYTQNVSLPSIKQKPYFHQISRQKIKSFIMSPKKSIARSQLEKDQINKIGNIYLKSAVKKPRSKAISSSQSRYNSLDIKQLSQLRSIREKMKTLSSLD